MVFVFPRISRFKLPAEQPRYLGPPSSGLSWAVSKDSSMCAGTWLRGFAIQHDPQLEQLFSGSSCQVQREFAPLHVSKSQTGCFRALAMASAAALTMPAPSPVNTTRRCPSAFCTLIFAVWQARVSALPPPKDFLDLQRTRKLPIHWVESVEQSEKCDVCFLVYIVPWVLCNNGDANRRNPKRGSDAFAAASLGESGCCRA